MQTLTHMHTYIYSCTWRYTYKHTDTYTQTCVHRHTHTYKHTRMVGVKMKDTKAEKKILCTVERELKSPFLLAGLASEMFLVALDLYPNFVLVS